LFRSAHLFLLAQPPDLPERLIGADLDFFFECPLERWCGTPGAIVAEARAAYRVAWRDPHSIRATCEDYRANATSDVALDQADHDAGRRIAAPTLVLWEQPPGVTLPFDPIVVWRRWADDVRGQALECGHFLPEERPAGVAAALVQFFTGPEDGKSARRRDSK
jgi:pimeloyl-ACP methyl ester carboxylesterase